MGLLFLMENKYFKLFFFYMINDSYNPLNNFEEYKEVWEQKIWELLM